MTPQLTTDACPSRPPSRLSRCARRGSTARSTLKPRLEVQIEQRSLPRPDAARHVDAEQPVEDREPHSRAADRPAGVTPRRTVTRPANVAEDRRAYRRHAVPELRASEPVRVAGLPRQR